MLILLRRLCYFSSSDRSTSSAVQSGKNTSTAFYTATSRAPYLDDRMRALENDFKFLQKKKGPDKLEEALKHVKILDALN